MQKNLPLPLTKVLQFDDGHNQAIQINIAWLNPQLHEVFANTIHFKPVVINERSYIYASEGERDMFDAYWNKQAPQEELQDGNGCRGIVHSFIAMMIIFFVIIIMAFLIGGCSSKNYQSKVEHRPRYNHWAKPYKMFAPVKSFNPSVK